MWDLLIENPYPAPIHARQKAEDYIKLMTSLTEAPPPPLCRLQTGEPRARETHGSIYSDFTHTVFFHRKRNRVFTFHEETPFRHVFFISVSN
jgi:hypothetical protein